VFIRDIRGKKEPPAPLPRLVAASRIICSTVLKMVKLMEFRMKRLEPRMNTNGHEYDFLGKLLDGAEVEWKALGEVADYTAIIQSR
jgi:hypothetical protein